MRHFFGDLLRDGAAPARLVHAATGTIVASHVEAAVDSRARRRGLLGRANLPTGHALIIAPCSSVHTWFMQFSIDVVFVTRDGRVVKVVNDLPAWRIAGAWRAFAAIELPAGTARLAGVTRGDRVMLQVPAVS